MIGRVEQEAEMIGKDVIRTEGWSKVTGAARYVDDFSLPGMLHGATVRSPVPHARIVGIERDPGFDWTGITVVDHAQIPGENTVLFHEKDQPCLAADIVRHAGEPVLLVAADSRERAYQAAAALRVQYDPLPAALTIEDALARTALVCGSDNVQKRITMEHGDVDAAFANAYRVVTGTYRTGRQEQMYLEPQGMIAWPEGDGVRVKGSLQCPYFVRPAVAGVLGLPEDKVAIEQAETGGAFGGKEEFPSMIASHAALLAVITGQPVKMVYSRNEDLVSTTKRHPSHITLRHAVNSDGEILAIDGRILLDGGAYSTVSPVVLSRAAIHISGPYRVPAIRIEALSLATNTLPSGAFRGFGAPQAQFAAERQMDSIARELNLSPLEARKRNWLRLGDQTVTGQTLESSVGLQQTVELALARSQYQQRRAELARTRGAGPLRCGIGLSFSYHGCAFTGGAEEFIKGTAGIELLHDGKIRVLTASTEMGQGSRTMFRQVAAAALDIPVDAVEVGPQDTSLVPNSGPTVASRTTAIVGSLVQLACADLLVRINDYAVAHHLAGTDNRELLARFAADEGPVRIDRTYKNPPGMTWDPERYRGDAYPCYSWKCDVVEVEVDLDTYDVRVTKITSASDPGTLIHPLHAAVQVEGGALQGAGLAALEDCRIDGGQVVHRKMTTCIVPTIMDAPEFDTSFAPQPFAHGPFGAKGLGELPVNGVPPAVAAAIDDATGVFVTEVPVTPDRLLHWLRSGQDGPPQPPLTQGGCCGKGDGQ